jgi:hypothetical protein
MSLFTHGALTFILVKHSEVNLKISELFDTGSKSMKNTGRGILDCLGRTLLIFFAGKPRDDYSFFMYDVSVVG